MRRRAPVFIALGGAVIGLGSLVLVLAVGDEGQAAIPLSVALVALVGMIAGGVVVARGRRAG